jgi:hypothetical protein
MKFLTDLRWIVRIINMDWILEAINSEAVIDSSSEETRDLVSCAGEVHERCC